MGQPNQSLSSAKWVKKDTDDHREKTKRIGSMRRKRGDPKLSIETNADPYQVSVLQMWEPAIVDMISTVVGRLKEAIVIVGRQ